MLYSYPAVSFEKLYSCGSEYEDCCILGCDSVQSKIYFLQTVQTQHGKQCLIICMQHSCGPYFRTLSHIHLSSISELVHR
jgi:hypothetical protein